MITEGPERRFFRSSPEFPTPEPPVIAGTSGGSRTSAPSRTFRRQSNEPRRRVLSPVVRAPHWSTRAAPVAWPMTTEEQRAWHAKCRSCPARLLPYLSSRPSRRPPLFLPLPFLLSSRSHSLAIAAEEA